MQHQKLNLIDEVTFEQELESSKNPIPVFKSALKNSQNRLFELFEENEPIEKLIMGRASFIDFLLTRAWKLKISDQEPDDIALIAVGGYGRNELHPCSDVDILILLQDNAENTYDQVITEFITLLWDIGIEIGSSVRTLAESVEEAQKDITIATNIIESRLIYGPDKLYQELNDNTGPDKIWPSPVFFEEKWKEQSKRHMKFHDTAYNLEPNIKESPGGLRDIQMIGWVAKRHFGELSLHNLVKYEFLTDSELNDLLNIQSFLWKVRFVLHMITNRREDRLLFEHQRVVAKILNFSDESQEGSFKKSTDRPADGNRLAVELFMKQYYRNVMELSRLNEMLLQHYQETILITNQKKSIKVINKRFQVNKGFLEVRADNTFQQYPFSLFELFLLLQENLQIRGVRASTIRLIRENLSVIDEDFRNDIRCKSLFIEIFKQPAGLTNALRRMNTYGILAEYIPTFGKIVGQMQFDLFHVYTVDQHTLFLVRNLRRFFVDAFQHEFPLCSEIIREIPKPELLYIAGVFHDIAKGRGGDHSVLGEVDAREFCEKHDLSPQDTDLVCWLVRNHLIMSSTAQHKDLSDPDVIFQFAQLAENNIKLDYLYLLTVADMRATNNKLWNSWKDSLLKTLRRQTKLAFQRGLDNPLQEAEKINLNKKLALQELQAKEIDPDQIADIWSNLNDEFFLRYNPQEISRYSRIMLENANQDTIVHVETNGINGGSDIFVKTEIRANLFAKISAALDLLNLNTVEAKIVSSSQDYALNTYCVFENGSKKIRSQDRIEEIKHTLLDYINDIQVHERRKMSRTTRRIECFIKPTEISFVDNEHNNRTNMEIITTDRRGLLAIIAEVFVKNDVRVSNAKIATLGAQVDDTFYIRDAKTKDCINQAQKENIKQELLKLLDG